MKTLHKAFSADVKISADEDRCVSVNMSTIAVDREGDVLIPQGCNSKDFEKNPIVCLNHSYWSLPVGKVTAIKRTEEAVQAKVEFASRPEAHPDGEEWIPDTLLSLFKQGVMNAVSVGFIPTDSRVANTRDMNKFGEECRRVINRWNLLELSVVPLPCNQEAVALAVSKGFVGQDTADKLFTPETPIEPETPAEPVKSATPSRTVEVRHVVKAAAPEPTRHVVEVIDPPAEKPRRIKAVVHVMGGETPDVSEKVRKAVVHVIAKHRGRVYL